MDYRAVAHRAVGEFFAAQDEYELSVILQLFHDPGIRRVIEIGTFAGGLTWALEQLPNVELIATVDFAKRPRHIGYKTNFIEGDSGDSKTVLAVDQVLDDSMADLLVIDGGHKLEEAMRDWELYRGFVRQGGMVMFHDINEWANHPEIQVRDAWLKVCEPYPHIEICANRWSAPGTGVLWLIGE